MSDGPGAALWRASNAWTRRLRAALAPHDLTQAQFLLLAGLARLEERLGRLEQAASVASLAP